VTSAESTSIVIVGHVDHGKSTLIGRLLYDTGNLAADRLADIRQTSEKLGRKMEFAFVMDQFREEREANVTIDTSQTLLKHKGRILTLIDAPGHKEYLKNMITGAAQAEFAVLLLDVNEGIREQTDKHAQILKLLRIEKLAVVINKMDMIHYEEKTFRQHEHEIRTLLKERDLPVEAIIPISAYEGENVAIRSKQMDWYTGETVLEFLDGCHPTRNDGADGALELPVQMVYRPNNEELVLGRLERGSLKKDQNVVVFPSGKVVKVEKIVKYEENPKIASAGESVALVLKPEGQVKRGDVICSEQKPAKGAREFGAHGFWAAEAPLRLDAPLLVECRTQSVPCRVTKLSGELGEGSLQELHAGDVAWIELRTEGDLLVEEEGPLSRVVFQIEGQVAGCGVVGSVLEKTA